MLIAKVNDNTVVKVSDYRDMFPNTSFSKGPSTQFLHDNGCMKVDTFLPHNQATQKLVPCDPYVDGNVVRTTKVEDKTAEEITAYNDSLAAKARRQRDNLLAACDWIVARAYEANEPVPTDWATYRQQLRDITLQEGFPQTIDWPLSPDANVEDSSL